MRTVTTSECNSFEEVRKLFEKAFDEIDDINFVIAPTKERHLKEIADVEAKAKKKAEAKAIKDAEAKAKAKELIEAQAIIDKAKAAEEATKRDADKRAMELKEAKKIIAASKKKGFISMKLLVFLVLFASLFVGVVQGEWAINYDNCSNPQNLVNLLRDRFANQTGNYFTFTPTSTAPVIAEGRVYYDDVTKRLKLRTDAAWVDIDVAGSSSLDTAYTIGQGITVDAGAVVLTATLAATNTALQIVQLDTATSLGIDIDNSGSGNSIDIQGASGNDIQGTDDSWAITTAGVMTMETVSGTTYSQDIIFDADNEIQFGDASDDVAMGFGTSRTLTWTTDTAVVTVNWGDLDSHTGLDDITFDAAGADNTITCAGSTTAKDLTIQQTGTGNASLILQSAGSGVDALSLISSVADIKLLSADNITRTAADDITDTTTDGAYTVAVGGGTDGIYTVTAASTGSITVADTFLIQNTEASKDLTVDSAAGSVIIDGGEAAAAAVTIIASATAGGIDADAGTGGITIDSTGVISIDGADDMNFTLTSSTDAEDLTIQVDGDDNCSIILDSDGTSTDAIKINASNAAGGIDMDFGTSGFSLVGASGDLVATVAGNSGDVITITNTTGTGTAGIALVGTACGLDVDIKKSIYLTSTANAADAVVIQSTLGGIDIRCDASDGDGLDISNADGAVNISSTHDADPSLHLTTSDTAGQILIDSGDESADGIDIDAAGGIDIDVTLEHFTIDLAAASKDFKVVSALGGIYLEGGISGADGVKIVASGANGGINMDAKAGGLDIDVVLGTIALDNTGAGFDITIDSSQGSLYLEGAQTGVTDSVKITAAAGLTMTSTAEHSAWTHTATGAADDLTISLAGTQVASLILTSAGTAEDALSLLVSGTSASAASILIDTADGGIVMTADGASKGDITIDAQDAITIISTSTAATALDVDVTSTGGDMTFNTSDGGMTFTAAGASNGQITLTSAHQLSLLATEDIIMTVTSGSSGEDILITQTGNADAHVTITSAGTTVDCIQLLESGSGTGGGILIKAATGTASAAGASSVQLDSTAGGIGIRAAVDDTDAVDIDATVGSVDIDGAKNVTIDAGTDITLTIASTATGDDLSLVVGGDVDAQIILDSDGTSAECILLQQNTAATGGIRLHANDSTAVTGGAASIELLSDLGGIGLTATGLTNTAAISLNAAAGGITMACVKDFLLTVTSAAGADDMTFTQAGTAPDAHITFNLNGTSADAFGIQATAGGIDIDAATDTIHIKNTADGDQDDITLQLAGSHDSSIILDNTQGTGADAISLQATAGSIDMDAVASGDITINGGQILVTSEHNTASAIALVSNTGTSETIVITNTQGQGTDAINIDTSGTGGGIDVDTADGTVAITAGGGSNGDITLTAGDVISLVAADVAGIVATTGTFEHKAKYFPISAGYTAASQVIVGGGQGVKCVGLAAGVEEEGSTEGYAESDTSTDFIRYWVPLPDDFVDTGLAADLILYFDIDEQMSAAGTIVVEVYSYNGVTPGTTAIVDDTLEVANDDTRQLYTLNTLSSGIGAVVVAGGEALMIEISQDHTDDDINLYGMKMVYRVGLQATE